MARREIANLGENETIDEVYLVSNKQLRPNRQGNLYLQMQIGDKSGQVNGMMWNANDHVYRKFDDGDYVRIQGTSQFYNGAMQIIVSGIERVDVKEVDESYFVHLGGAEIDGLRGQLAEMLRGMKNPHLRNLAECFLIDEEFMQRFCRAPAGVKNHHAYHGGLLEHVVNLMKVSQAIVPFYPQIDADLLLIGAFTHDLGKIEELTYDKGFAYSDEGQLIGHLVMGVALIDEKAHEAEKLGGEPMPYELVLRVKHMVVSHHGKLEFGSPKVPMTLEALALNYLDTLDAHVISYGKLIEEDINTDSAWTIFHAPIGRKLYKGEPPRS
ncbi:OB-fold nucleic acid binding domain-containing protein [Blastopirellula sp. J2-11]|uniref:3'-5' exoribonuclease YhaM family protein n=1 Tax=Blastopirellula sp. J2-11 TaxID=2943192 RepID=UPI0021C56784|nr:OB-fold nucleic acid binding domain-containing protein [Blastopirellula sp. J2-11]UUO07398.1 OB-fold nucleic acid binding domain-containing protein [Blastopirellula sp. J2-11]